MNKEYLTLDKIEAYRISFDLSNRIWEIVIHWDNFAKWTIGKQFVDAIDSIGANIAEGFGRYHKKEKIHFYRYGYGSMEESKDWLRKAIVRSLISTNEKEEILAKLEKLPLALNQLIHYTNRKLKY